MMGLNLHAIVRGAIAAVHPDESVTLYQSTGQNNVKGKIVPVYAAPQSVQAQVQSEGDDKLFHADRKGENETTRRMYLYADSENTDMRPAGVVRPLARGGDFILRGDGTWWFVVGTPDEFARVGWVSVRVVLQVIGPDLSASEQDALSRAEAAGCKPGFTPGVATSPIASVAQDVRTERHLKRGQP